uniref:Uncharacterized protein n=1 Tax=Oryza brachyantha TaxID=4533 RepID=J3LQP2_ORYBR
MVGLMTMTEDRGILNPGMPFSTNFSNYLSLIVLLIQICSFKKCIVITSKNLSIFNFCIFLLQLLFVSGGGGPGGVGLGLNTELDVNITSYSDETFDCFIFKKVEMKS